MADTNQEFPYKPLGSRLRGMRERHRESLAEVSGAVEIELDALTAIEQGAHRPSEDILLLLISHFGVKEDEATSLWNLAGYEKDGTMFGMSADEFGTIKNGVMVLPLDLRISYTDMAHVIVNNHGVVLNFMQSNGLNNQPMVVSRLGMSREHAESIVELLQHALSGSDEKSIRALPAPDAKAESTESPSDSKSK